MPTESDDQSLTILDLVGEARDATQRLVDLLRELRTKNPLFYQNIFSDVCSKLELVNSGEIAPAPLREEDVQPTSIEPIQFAVANVNGEKVKSFFQPSDFSQQKLKNKMQRAAAVEEAILALLLANKGGVRTIVFQDISQELIRLNLGEQANTTYTKISRLRKDKLIAEKSEDNPQDYFLTDAGVACAQKMLVKRGIQKSDDPVAPAQ